MQISEQKMKDTNNRTEGDDSIIEFYLSVSRTVFLILKEHKKRLIGRISSYLK
jgi:hypothetical protein